jgi:hypothetical protein
MQIDTPRLTAQRIGIIVALGLDLGNAQATGMPLEQYPLISKRDQVCGQRSAISNKHHKRNLHPSGGATQGAICGKVDGVFRGDTIAIKDTFSTTKDPSGWMLTHRSVKRANKFLDLWTPP